MANADELVARLRREIPPVPSNEVPGKSGYIRVSQDGTGSRTLAFGTDYEFAGGSTPTLTTSANAQDMLFYQIIAADRVLVSPVLDIS